MKHLLLIIALAAVVFPAQADYTQYVGRITVTSNTLPLAADSAGNIFYGTLNGGSTTAGVFVKFIPNPNAAIGVAEDQGVTISQLTNYPVTRGLQGIAVATDGTVFTAGDPNVTTTSLRKFTGTAATTYTEDLTFFNNVNATANRRSGVDIVSEAGAGLIVTNTFNSINYFKFDGTASGLTNVAGGGNFKREPIFNNTDNVIYTPRNGNFTDNILDGYFSNVNTATGGGTWNAVASLLSDGANNTTFGVATQHGYYNEQTHQLITCDTIANDSGTTQVRVWNISNGGATLTLDHAIDATLGGANWSTISDALVIGNRLYVSSSLHAAIYVYEDPLANVREWTLY